MQIIRLLISSILASALLANACAARMQVAAPDQASIIELNLPLEQGRLNVRDVIVGLGREFGVKMDDSLSGLDWSIDVRSTLGRLQLHALEQLTGGVIEISAGTAQAIVRIDKAALGTKLADAGRTAERWIADVGGRSGQQAARAYGLSLVTADNPRTRLADAATVPSRLVVLIHGLDDPGFMWRDLVPELQKAGHPIARFDYPNDGPISESADLLAVCLTQARAAGVKHVDLVAHSMGGLVARDVLTRSSYYRGDGRGGDQYPAIDRLIMLGTPNHGSHLARLRGLTEIGEQVYRLLTASQTPTPEIGDGSGEAGVDLLPDSDFLRRLNSRPPVSYTRCTCIAGRWSPVDAGDVDRLLERIRSAAGAKAAPSWLHNWVSESNTQMAMSMVKGAVDGLGDGCVTLESSRLEGIDDFVIVRANHVDMLIRLGSTTGPLPPAIPIILDRLQRP